MAIEVCSQFLPHIFYKRSHIHPRIYDITSKIYHHQNTRKKEQLNCHLDLVVYDNSITIVIYQYLLANYLLSIC